MEVVDVYYHSMWCSMYDYCTLKPLTPMRSGGGYGSCAIILPPRRRRIKLTDDVDALRRLTSVVILWGTQGVPRNGGRQFELV